VGLLLGGEVSPGFWGSLSRKELTPHTPAGGVYSRILVNFSEQRLEDVGMLIGMLTPVVRGWK
jgi:hypothetical protein